MHKSQEWLADKYQDDAKQWGEQKLSVWENYAKWMSSNQVLEGEFDAKKPLLMISYLKRRPNKMANSLISVQIIPKTEKYEDVIPYVDAKNCGDRCFWGEI